jgi:hypothetical protein
MWGAVRTILIADAVMSLDNVIAVAAAAKGNFTLLVLGLVISIPMVVFGAAILLKLIDRFPIIVTVGAALIGYVAGEVMVTDPLFQDWVDAHAHWLHWVAPPLGAAGLVAVADVFVRRVPMPETAGEALGAPAAVFGARAVLAAMAGLIGGKIALVTEGAGGWLQRIGPLAEDVGPALIAAAVVGLVEVLARLARRARRG